MECILELREWVQSEEVLGAWSCRAVTTNEPQMYLNVTTHLHPVPFHHSSLICRHQGLDRACVGR